MSVFSGFLVFKRTSTCKMSLFPLLLRVFQLRLAFFCLNIDIASYISKTIECKACLSVPTSLQISIRPWNVLSPQIWSAYLSAQISQISSPSSQMSKKGSIPLGCLVSWSLGVQKVNITHTCFLLWPGVYISS